MGSLRMRAPRCCRTGKSSHRVHGESGASDDPGWPREKEKLAAESLNLHQGPHLTTRFAACSHVPNRSGPDSSQPSGTGASLRFSPSLSKQSQPWLYSLATSMLRRKGLRRRSGVSRRSANPPSPGRAVEAARRSALRLSAAAGVTSQTSHRLPVVSRKVR
jgi:hypothetical protein